MSTSSTATSTKRRFPFFTRLCCGIVLASVWVDSTFPGVTPLNQRDIGLRSELHLTYIMNSKEANRNLIAILRFLICQQTSLHDVERFVEATSSPFPKLRMVLCGGTTCSYSLRPACSFHIFGRLQTSTAFDTIGTTPVHHGRRPGELFQACSSSCCGDNVSVKRTVYSG